VESEMKITNWEQVFSLYALSAVKRVEFVSDRTSYIVLRGRLIDIIVLNVHERNEEKIDYSKEELEQFSKIFLSTVLKFS